MQKSQKILDVNSFSASYKNLIKISPETYGSLNNSDELIQKAYKIYVNIKIVQKCKIKTKILFLFSILEEGSLI